MTFRLLPAPHLRSLRPALVRWSARPATALLTLALAWAAPTLSSAETVIVSETTILRGEGSQPEVLLDGSNLIAAMRDDEQRFMMLHYRIGEDGDLTGGFKTVGTPSVAHDVIHTLWGTPVTATLHMDTDSTTRGALTLDTFELKDGAISHLDRHRAIPPASGGGVLAKVTMEAASGNAGPSRTTGSTPRAGTPVAATGSLTTETGPGVYAREVAVEDVSFFQPDHGLESERVVTAIIDADGELQLDTWELGAGKKISHVHSNTEAGVASKVALVRWSKGVITAMIDSGGRSRFIAWEITPAGDIVRHSTGTSVLGRDVDVARFNALGEDDRYIAVIRQNDNRVRAILVEVGADGQSQQILAQGVAPDDTSGKATQLDVGDAARVEDGAFAPDSFYSATRDTSGKLRLTKWLYQSGALNPVIRKQIDQQVTHVALALDPYAPRVRDDADTFGTVVRNPDGTMSVGLWSSYFRDLAAADDLKDPNDGKDVTRTPGLRFSSNSAGNVHFGSQYPADMPAPRLPTDFDACSAQDIEIIRAAWVRGHYFMWRTQQVMTWLKDNPDYRSAAWEELYDHEIGNVEAGFSNFAPRGWFGRYDSGRFDQARRAIDKAWNERFVGKTFSVQCRNNADTHGAHPCNTADPSANHIVYGTINFCDNFFEPGRSLDQRGRLVVHEVFHWLKIPDSVFWVTDTHDYWDKCGAAGYHVATQLYGNKAAFIANNQGCNERNYRRAVRNNDNYAYFAREMGSRVYAGTIEEFPSRSFWD